MHLVQLKSPYNLDNVKIHVLKTYPPTLSSLTYVQIAFPISLFYEFFLAKLHISYTSSITIGLEKHSEQQSHNLNVTLSGNFLC